MTFSRYLYGLIIAATLPCITTSAMLAAAPAYAQETSTQWSAPMPEAAYWAIIETSLQQSATLEEQEDYLAGVMEQMQPEQLVAFKLRTDQLLMDSYSSNLWCAAYLMMGGCGAQEYTSFRCWLISRGQKIYTLGISHPDDIAYAVQSNLYSTFDFDALQDLPATIFQQKMQSDISSHIDFTKVSSRPEDYPPLQINWREQVPGTMQAICPKLYQLFWQ